MPSSEESDINNDVIKEKSSSAPKRKRKIKQKEKQGRTRTRNVKEWVDIKSKTSLDLGLENRKGKMIKGKQMRRTCKENCKLKCASQISYATREV